MSNGDIASFESLVLKNKNINSHPQLSENLTAYLEAVTVEGYIPPEDIINAIYELVPADDKAQAVLNDLIEEFQSEGLSLAIVSDGGGTAATITVDENSPEVTTIVAVDPQADEITYSISGGAAANLFSIDFATGELTFIGAPDYENPEDIDGDNVYEIVVQATDASSGQADSQTISVVVNDVNEASTFTYFEDFEDGIPNGGNWSYRTGPSVTEESGWLKIAQDRTDDGGGATYTLDQAIRNPEVSFREFYHAENNNFFGGTNLRFLGADGEIISVKYAPLKSSYGPDYGSDPANYNHPRLEIEGPGDGYPANNFFFDYNNNSSDLLDVWVDTIITVDSDLGLVEVDGNGDGIIDISVQDDRLIDAGLLSTGLDGYGWFTGHYRLIDEMTISGVVDDSLVF